MTLADGRARHDGVDTVVRRGIAVIVEAVADLDPGRDLGLGDLKPPAQAALDLGAALADIGSRDDVSDAVVAA